MIANTAFNSCPTCERRQDQEHAEWCDLRGTRFPNHKNNAPEMTETEVDLCEDCVMGVAGLLERPAEEYVLCPEWHGWDFVSIENEYGEAEQHFSKSQCDGCHSTLWGSRYPHTAVHVSQSPKEDS